MADFDRARLTFTIRARAAGGWRYDTLAAYIDSEVRTAVPPAIGDLIRVPNKPGLFRIVDREWRYPDRGALTWPSPRTSGPVSLGLMLEAADGMYVDEAPLSEGEDDD